MAESEAASAKIIAEEGPLKDLAFSFERGDQWIIGRDPSVAQLLLEDPAVSRKHLICKRTPSGIIAENLSTTNPTQVNEEILKEPRLLHQGDLMKIGSGLYRFYSQPHSHVFDEEGFANGFSEPRVQESRVQESIENSPTPEQNENLMPLQTDDETSLELEDKEKLQDFSYEEAPEQSADIAEINFDLMDTGRWLLKVIGGPNTGAEFAMQANGSYLIGTDPNTCDIIFHDTSVSRQHARISISAEEKLAIEDLKSSNGTRIEGELIEGKTSLPPNAVITLGTTSFIVYDREGEMQTIISPLLPSIVKVLKEEEAKKQDSAAEALPVPKKEEEKMHPAEKAMHNVGALIVIGVITGIFILTGIGIKTLFEEEPVAIERAVDVDKILAEAAKAFPSVRYSFNKATGRLLLVGHVMTLTDRNQLLYNLEGLKFIKDIDKTGVVIDEYVRSEANQILSKNPRWKGITVQSQVPGKFVLSGYLQSRAQAEQVWDYMSANFSYLDLLENKIVVEEDILDKVNTGLASGGFNTVLAQMNNGELILTGNIPSGKKQAFDSLVKGFGEISGVRGLKNLVAEVAPEEALINITSKYEVTGFSKGEGGKLSVMISGRILSEGDVLDGMKIIAIRPQSILLEKGGTQYRIDYNR